METLESIHLGISLFLILLYHIYYFIVLFKKPDKLTIGTVLQSRRRWVNTVITSTGLEQVALQSIRNAIFALSWYSTSAITLGFFMLQQGLSYIPTTTGGERKSVSGNETDPLYSFYFVGGIMFAGFFNFALAMRNFLHVDFMLNMRSVSEEVLREIDLPDDSRYIYTATPEKTAILPPEIDIWRLEHIKSAHRLMERAVAHHALGIRCFFFTFPVGMWALSSWAMLVGTIFIICVIFYFDTI